MSKGIQDFKIYELVELGVGDNYEADTEVDRLARCVSLLELHAAVGEKLFYGSAADNIHRGEWHFVEDPGRHARSSDRKIAPSIITAIDVYGVPYDPKRGLTGLSNEEYGVVAQSNSFLIQSLDPLLGAPADSSDYQFTGMWAKMDKQERMAHVRSCWESSSMSPIFQYKYKYYAYVRTNVRCNERTARRIYGFYQGHDASLSPDKKYTEELGRQQDRDAWMMAEQRDSDAVRIKQLQQTYKTIKNKATVDTLKKMPRRWRP